MVLNFGMLNNRAFKKATNNFSIFYSLKNICDPSHEKGRVGCNLAKFVFLQK